VSPYELPDCAGKPYRPSNGTEGMMFMEYFCDRCIYNSEEEGCEIIMRTMMHDVSEPEYPSEWLHDFKGRPQCTQFIENG
jgi:hypothetical protein